MMCAAVLCFIIHPAPCSDSPTVHEWFCLGAACFSLSGSYRAWAVFVCSLAGRTWQCDLQNWVARAPEVILGLPYDQKIDLWPSRQESSSFACLYLRHNPRHIMTREAFFTVKMSS